MSARALQPGIGLKTANGLFVAFWCLLAAFPLFWIVVMSFKLPLDAFADDPLSVIFGPLTRASGRGLSLLDIVLGLATLGLFFWLAFSKLPGWVRDGAGAFDRRFATGGEAPGDMAQTRTAPVFAGWVIGVVGLAVAFVVVLFLVLPAISGLLNPVLGPLGQPLIGFTGEAYERVWVDRRFYVNFGNSMLVTFGVVTISLTIGTLAGYALARSGSQLAFWLLVIALIFRALPHSVLVAGYLPLFINSAELLRPILGDAAPTLYGKPFAVIAVLVSINQPFTIWMLRSFFQSIPHELDEAARVDGCSHFQAFRRVIMPVMWPGVITTGLFSFLLAYNDYLVCSLLLDANNQTMVPAIASFFNRETTTTDQVTAIAAAVSITAPLFVLVMVFQRQIVSGLTAGAVKG